MTKFILTLLLIAFSCSCYNNIEYEEEDITDNEKLELVYFNKQNINSYPVEQVLAGIAEHECGNLSMTERHLVMEAVYNRVINNFNNNGLTLQQQLLAKNQFTGLFEINPKHFYFDPNNNRHYANYLMAKDIIRGNRMTHKRIYYWAGTCDRRTKHYKQIFKNRLLGFNTKNIFA